ncbi:hypothetical protein F8M41_023051 [Gigaspora margarita]|uniref:Uncharacterized protein n=1 Tax=Gigaspora margarita TaxID=4874 RepID=A0A8H4AE48_GIGMA|nr:hypothetical protein F8M41_023051 [Gigaspora margarita]
MAYGVFRNLFDVLELFSGSFLANLSERGSKTSKSSLQNVGLFSGSSQRYLGIVLWQFPLNVLKLFSGRFLGILEPLSGSSLWHFEAVL